MFLYEVYIYKFPLKPKNICLTKYLDAKKLVAMVTKGGGYGNVAVTSQNDPVFGIANLRMPVSMATSEKFLRSRAHFLFLKMFAISPGRI